ncbi:MAG: hypothetical protein JW787_05460 [Sedimentisphaerales bacterium]|nr:hypothetical protein [Sedimentisphaerales bacterium]
MTKKTIFNTILIIFFYAPVYVQAQTEPNNWDKLNLSSTTIAGAKVYYEKSFEPNLPFFEKMYKEFLAAKDKQNILNSKKEQILADINLILGIKEPPAEKQEKMWMELSGVLSGFKTITFYLVKQSTMKDFVRAGGQLPNFTYDKLTDTAAYNPNFVVTSEDTQDKTFEFAFPIESVEKFENNVDMIFKMFGDVGNIHEGVIIHEITEISMLVYIKQTDQYWRWFSDGFSNAITYELLKKHFDISRAEEWLKDWDTSQYKDLEKEIDLRYWMSGKFCLLHLDNLPIERDKELTLARYAYSTFEAHRLIDKFGIDCVRKILDEIRAKQSRSGEDLIEAVKNVTGEDMNVRFAAYQSFDTKQEGIAKYVKAFNEASAKKDIEPMLFNLFRMHDLRSLSEVENLLNDYRYAAVLLFKMGFEQQADAIMQNCREFFSNSGYKNGQRAAAEVFMVYALECEKPLKARMEADDILKTDPDNVSAMTIKMFVYLNDKQLTHAQETAKKIISLIKDEKSKNYQVASQVLAIDPNQIKPAQ